MRYNVAVNTPRMHEVAGPFFYKGNRSHRVLCWALCSHVQLCVAVCDYMRAALVWKDLERAVGKSGKRWLT